MKGLKIVLAWALTVIFGSIIYPLIFLFFGGFGNGVLPRGGGEVIPMFALISAFISALASLPTLITLLIVHAVNVEKNTRAYLKSVNIAHTIMFVVTVVVGDLWIYLKNNEFLFGALLLSYTVVVSVYAATGVVVWVLLYRKSWKSAALLEKEKDSDVLDDLEPEKARLN